MSLQLSSDEIKKICANLVYQVAYSYYDTPYIIILKLMVHDNVTTELELANKIGLTTPEVRKYMGTLHLHRLVRRHVNKEKVPIPEWRLKQLASQPARGSGQPLPAVAGSAGIAPNGKSIGASGAGGGGAVDKDGKPIQERERTKDVYYWYLDYREFANVVKYRLAMMRKDIDERIKREVGHRGYICPMDGRMYDPLDLSNVFDPFTNSFKCEDCSTELIEHDPSISPNGVNTTAQDAMQRFNIATAPIRDALKAVEAITVPSLNIVAWIAQNVKTTVAKIDGQGTDEDGKKFEVVMGQEEEDQKAKERLAQQQREQNALPHWYTHSTVTGQATTLGLADRKRREMLDERNRSLTSGKKGAEDDVLAAHYEILGGDEDDLEDVGGEAMETPSVVGVEVKKESNTNGAATAKGINDDDDGEEDDGMEDIEPTLTPIGAAAAKDRETGVSGGKTVTVNGVSKRIEEVMDEDHELMTTEEYEAYAEAMYG